jgi:hypothetical protein
MSENSKRKVTSKSPLITRKQEELKICIENNTFSIFVNKQIVDDLKEGEKCFFDKCTNTIKCDFFKTSKKVQNVYRYMIERNGEKKFELYEFCEKNGYRNESFFNERDIKLENKYSSIVILLESPHKDEYDANFNPKAPAQGCTGLKIEENIAELLNRRCFSFLCESKYRLLIINPIPFQTSLYQIHKKSISGVYKTLRDKVWCAIWKNCSNLITDMKSILNSVSPKLVLNCCTADIKEHIDLSFCNCKTYNIDHPSSWWKGIDKINIKEVRQGCS